MVFYIEMHRMENRVRSIKNWMLDRNAKTNAFTCLFPLQFDDHKVIYLYRTRTFETSMASILSTEVGKKDKKKLSFKLMVLLYGSLCSIKIYDADGCICKFCTIELVKVF